MRKEPAEVSGNLDNEPPTKKVKPKTLYGELSDIIINYSKVCLQVLTAQSGIMPRKPRQRQLLPSVPRTQRLIMTNVRLCTISIEMP